jgi:hypothetical protein
MNWMVNSSIHPTYKDWRALPPRCRTHAGQQQPSTLDFVPLLNKLADVLPDP